MRRALWIIPLGLALLAAWAAVCLYLPYQGFSRAGVYVDIPRGASRRTIGRLLAENGVVHSRWVFEGLSRWRARRTLEAGEYFFDHPQTAFQVFDTIAAGRVYVRTLVVPEGYNMFDIANLVEREGFMSHGAFLAAVEDPTPIRDLAPRAPSLEGFLFPATYEFPRHISAQDMVGAMVKRFRQQWDAIRAAAGDPDGLSVRQIVTLASLVERETSAPDERPLIAGVFYNRLRRRFPLQCDPTVVYALELAGEYDGSLDRGDLEFRSPYNTYRHIGLPPGPIANPGEAALRAALDPESTDYLYFVANTQGGHFFSKTLREHIRNVHRYRRLLQQNGSTRGDAPAEPPQTKNVSKRPR